MPPPSSKRSGAGASSGAVLSRSASLAGLASAAAPPLPAPSCALAWPRARRLDATRRGLRGDLHGQQRAVRGEVPPQRAAGSGRTQRRRVMARVAAVGERVGAAPVAGDQREAVAAVGEAVEQPGGDPHRERVADLGLRPRDDDRAAGGQREVGQRDAPVVVAQLEAGELDRCPPHVRHLDPLEGRVGAGLHGVGQQLGDAQRERRGADRRGARLGARACRRGGRGRAGRGRRRPRGRSTPARSRAGTRWATGSAWESGSAWASGSASGPRHPRRTRRRRPASPGRRRAGAA